MRIGHASNGRFDLGCVWPAVDKEWACAGVRAGLRRHLARLIDLELAAVHRRANAFAYELVWEPDTAGDDRDRATIARVARDRSQA